jgi:carbon storage regulator
MPFNREEVMLVLSRRSGETVVIGDEIRVTVLEIRGNSVKLGLEAPREVPLRRAELPIESNARAAPVFPATSTYIVEAVLGPPS